ncbi:hypothetical protein [Undibacterium sp. RuTC16W]|uniref:hypothetical protein n=1 Tax=Undibacterium sp. RuTC16W TaxID=3413048 RepID=UPI003BF0C60C
MDENIIHIGIADFTDPTLLIVGSANELISLSKLFDMEIFDFLDISKFFISVGINLNIQIVKNDSDVTVLYKKIDWFLNCKDARNFASQIRELVKFEFPSHIYLNCSKNQSIEIVVSKDEYDPNIVFS